MTGAGAYSGQEKKQDWNKTEAEGPMNTVSTGFWKFGLYLKEKGIGFSIEEYVFGLTNINIIKILNFQK